MTNILAWSSVNTALFDVVYSVTLGRVNLPRLLLSQNSVDISILLFSFL